jgi:hypothetical protein
MILCGARLLFDLRSILSKVLRINAFAQTGKLTTSRLGSGLGVSHVLALFIINFIFGTLLGRRFTVLIVIPLAGVVVVEALFIESVGAFWSALAWHSAILIVAVELGFLFGALVLRLVSTACRDVRSKLRIALGKQPS